MDGRMFDDVPKMLAVMGLIIFALGFGLGHCHAGCAYSIRIERKQPTDGGSNN